VGFVGAQERLRLKGYKKNGTGGIFIMLFLFEKTSENVDKLFDV